MDRLLLDLRFALRQLRRRPLFALAAAYRELLDEVRALPGVGEAGGVWDLPTVGGAGSSSWSLVVEDVRQRGVAEDPVGEMYFPHRQSFEGAYTSPREMTLVVRHTIDPAALAPALRRIAESLPGPPAVLDVRNLDQVRSLGLARERFLVTLFGLFSAAALGPWWGPRLVSSGIGTEESRSGRRRPRRRRGAPR